MTTILAIDESRYNSGAEYSVPITNTMPPAPARLYSDAGAVAFRSTDGMTRRCTVVSCTLPHVSRGFCAPHYARWRRHGSPTEGTAPRPYGQSEGERFWSKVNKAGPNGCWLWVGLHVGGYGRFHLEGVGARLVRAHRYAFEALRGPIPDGFQLDHLCRNTGCVNPDHLEAVTPRENTLRSTAVSAVNARATHCPAGHEYNSENTYRTPSGWRVCRACHRERERRATQ